MENASRQAAGRALLPYTHLLLSVRKQFSVCIGADRHFRPNLRRRLQVMETRMTTVPAAAAAAAAQ